MASTHFSDLAGYVGTNPDAIKFDVRIDSGEQKDYLFKLDKPYDRCEFLKDKLGERTTVRVTPHNVCDITICVDDYAVCGLELKGMQTDMFASIVSPTNHLTDQIQRMIRTEIPLLIVLIAGPYPADPEQQRVIKRKIFHLHALPLIKVVQVRDREMATAEFLKALLDDIASNLTRDRRSIYTRIPMFEVAMIKGQRPKLDTQNNVWFEMLLMPLRIGPAVAEAMQARFPTFMSLLRFYGEKLVEYRTHGYCKTPEHKKREKPPANEIEMLENALHDHVVFRTDTSTGEQTYIRKADSVMYFRTLINASTELDGLVALVGVAKATEDDADSDEKPIVKAKHRPKKRVVVDDLSE